MYISNEDNSIKMIDKTKFPKFNKDQRSTFRYWFWHYLSFNMVAMELKAWRFKYLFHDIEKPWLKLILRDYKKVQKWHRVHNSHHLEYKGERDWQAMVIDWEASRYTKQSCIRNAVEETNFLFENNKINYNEYCNLILTCRKLKLI